MYFNAAFIKKVNFANHRTPIGERLNLCPFSKFFPEKSKCWWLWWICSYFEGDPKDYNATIGFKSVLNDWNIDASFTTGGNSQTYKVNQSHNRNFVYVPTYNTTRRIWCNFYTERTKIFWSRRNRFLSQCLN
jgi:iron complex outermembrane receptor protein